MCVASYLETPHAKKAGHQVMPALNSEQDPCFAAEKNLGMNQYDMELEFINDVFDTAFMNGGLTERLSGRKSH